MVEKTSIRNEIDWIEDEFIFHTDIAYDFNKHEWIHYNFWSLKNAVGVNQWFNHNQSSANEHIYPIMNDRLIFRWSKSGSQIKIRSLVTELYW